MSAAHFTVFFRGERPDDLRVGDKLTLSGTVTVAGISGDLIEITSLGSDPEFTLGDVEVALVPNRLEVAP